MSEEIKAAKVMELKGLPCPMPVVKVSKGIKEVEVGQIVKTVTGRTPGPFLTSLPDLSKAELSSNLTLSGHFFMLVLHVFFANLFLMFFPFSKVMHAFLSLPMNKLRRG